MHALRPGREMVENLTLDDPLGLLVSYIPPCMLSKSSCLGTLSAMAGWAMGLRLA
jgi:hypothetical protein